jgi:integrase
MFDDVKSRAGRRTIALPERVVTLLTEHQRAQQREREIAGNLWEDHGFVFTSETGRPVDPRADNREWSELLTGLHPSPTRHAVAGLGGRAPVGGMRP